VTLNDARTFDRLVTLNDVRTFDVPVYNTTDTTFRNTIHDDGRRRCLCLTVRFVSAGLAEYSAAPSSVDSVDMVKDEFRLPTSGSVGTLDQTNIDTAQTLSIGRMTKGRTVGRCSFAFSYRCAEGRLDPC
jgi:hypothetical protein